MDLKLNPALDPAALAVRYREKGRIQIKDFLSPTSARAVLEELVSRYKNAQVFTGRQLAAQSGGTPIN